MSSAIARTRLDVLLEERAAALRSPLRANRTYMSDLEGEIALLRAAYTAAAVTEIAVMQAGLAGTLQG